MEHAIGELNDYKAVGSFGGRAKENPKLSSYRYASGTKPPIKALPQSHHSIGGLTHCRASKEETMAIKRVWVLILAANLLHVIQVISNILITIVNLFESITIIYPASIQQRAANGPPVICLEMAYLW